MRRACAWMHHRCSVGAPGVPCAPLGAGQRHGADVTLQPSARRPLPKRPGPGTGMSCWSPGTRGAPWSWACTGEGDEHPGHLLPHPTIPRVPGAAPVAVQQLRGAAVGVSGTGSAAGPDPLQHGDKPPAPLSRAGAGDTRRDLCPPPLSLLRHCQCR